MKKLLLLLVLLFPSLAVASEQTDADAERVSATDWGTAATQSASDASNWYSQASNLNTYIQSPQVQSQINALNPMLKNYFIQQYYGFCAEVGTGNTDMNDGVAGLSDYAVELSDGDNYYGAGLYQDAFIEYDYAVNFASEAKGDFDAAYDEYRNATQTMQSVMTFCGIH